MNTPVPIIVQPRDANPLRTIAIGILVAVLFHGLVYGVAQEVAQRTSIMNALPRLPEPERRAMVEPPEPLVKVDLSLPEPPKPEPEPEPTPVPEDPLEADADIPAEPEPEPEPEPKQVEPPKPEPPPKKPPKRKRRPRKVAKAKPEPPKKKAFDEAQFADAGSMASLDMGATGPGGTMTVAVGNSGVGGRFGRGGTASGKASPKGVSRKPPPKRRGSPTGDPDGTDLSLIHI